MPTNHLKLTQQPSQHITLDQIHLPSGTKQTQLSHTGIHGFTCTLNYAATFEFFSLTFSQQPRIYLFDIAFEEHFWPFFWLYYCI